MYLHTLIYPCIALAYKLLSPYLNEVPIRLLFIYIYTHFYSYVTIIAFNFLLYLYSHLKVEAQNLYYVLYSVYIFYYSFKNILD